MRRRHRPPQACSRAPSREPPGDGPAPAPLFPGVVRLSYWGRLGNRLAEYCVARRLAIELDFSLSAEAIDGFPNARTFGRDWRSRLPVGPREVVHTAHQLSLPAIVSNRRPRVIDLQGLFLRYDFFQPYKTEIRQIWLQTTGHPPLGDDDLTIHVRGGDVWQNNARGDEVLAEYHALPFSFYAQIVGQRRWSRIFVVSEDARDPMVRKIAATFTATVVSGTVLHDFLLLRASTNLVLSVSSFAWWAGWLSEARRIYYPLAGLFDPERAGRRPFPWQQNLWVYDEDRYIPVRPPVPDSDWKGTEADRRRLLET